MNGYMNHDTALPQLRWPQLVRAIGQPFIIVPLSSLATGALTLDQQAQGSAIFNVMRNLGGSIGIAMLSTFTTIREHYHFAVISDRVTRDNLLTQGRVADAAHAFAVKSGAALGHVQALGYIRNIVRRDAFVMAYSDCFFAMGVGLLLSILTLLAIPAAKPAEPAG